MNTSHPLFQSRRIPRDVPVEHQPAELQINAFPRRICADEKPRATIGLGFPEAVHLLLPFGVMHAAVDLGNFAGESQSVESTDEVIERVPMLSKDDQLLAREF